MVEGNTKAPAAAAFARASRAPRLRARRRRHRRCLIGFPVASPITPLNSDKALTSFWSARGAAHGRGMARWTRARTGDLLLAQCPAVRLLLCAACEGFETVQRQAGLQSLYFKCVCKQSTTLSFLHSETDRDILNALTLHAPAAKKELSTRSTHRERRRSGDHSAAHQQHHSLVAHPY